MYCHLFATTTFLHTGNPWGAKQFAPLLLPLNFNLYYHTVRILQIRI